MKLTADELHEQRSNQRSDASKSERTSVRSVSRYYGFRIRHMYRSRMYELQPWHG